LNTTSFALSHTDKNHNYREEAFASKLAIFIDVQKEIQSANVSEQFALSEDNFFWPNNFLINSNLISLNTFLLSITQNIEFQPSESLNEVLQYIIEATST